MAEQDFQFTDEPVLDEQAEAPVSAKPYSEMDWGEFAKTTAKNAPGSFWNALTALPSALWNYDETGKALYQVGSGIASKLSDVPLVATYTPEGKETRVVPSVREMFGTPRSAEEKAAIEAPVEQFAEALVEPVTSKEAFYRTVAEDPFGVLSTLSIPVTGGGSALVKGGQLAGTASKAGRALEAAGKGIQKAGTVLDPTGAVIEGAEAGGTLGRFLTQKGQAALTGAPYESFSKAFDAAVLSGEKGKQYRNDFLSYLKGNGSSADFEKSVTDAFKQLEEAEKNKWLIEKGDALGARTQPVSFDPIMLKFDALRDEYGGNGPIAIHAHPDAHAALDEAQNAVLAYQMSPRLEDKTLVGLDKLKKRLYEIAQKHPEGEGRNAVMGVWQSVRDQLAATSPEYDALMTKFQNMKKELDDVRKNIGADNPRLSPSGTLARAIASQKTPQKQQLLDKLSEIDPSIAYKVAGATLHNLTPTGFPQKLLEVGSAVPWSAGAFNAIMQGQPLTAAALAAGYGAQAVAQSPRAMARANYAAGRTSGLTAPVVAPVADVVEAAAPIAVTAQSAKERQRPVFEFTDEPVLETNEQASGGRVARKSGGRIRSNPISAEVKRVRALLSQKTANMLSLPDDAIATALDLAKRT